MSEIWVSFKFKILLNQNYSTEGLEEQRPKLDVYNACRLNLDHVGRFFIFYFFCPKLASSVQRLVNEIVGSSRFFETLKNIEIITTVISCLW